MSQDEEYERQVEEEFDRYIRRAIFDASNEYRKEKGWPLLSEDEFDYNEDDLPDSEDIP